MVGKLLVASPSILNDHVFSRSVILMTENSSIGSMGFIVNKETNYSLEDLIPESKLNVPLFDGGPVNNDKLFYIHNNKNIPESIKIAENLFWGGDFNFIMNGIKEKKFHINSFKFISGYSGWEKNQLENEIKLKSWLIIKNDYDLIKIKNNLWSKIIKDVGGETAYFFMAPDYPGLN